MTPLAPLMLRPALWWDRWFVLRLRNDPDVMRQSVHPARAWSAWWRVVKPMLLIIVSGDRCRLGYIIIGARRDVSIVLAPKYRRLGLGTAALFYLRYQHGDLHALIKPDNVASIHAFTRAGWDEDGSTNSGLLRFTS